MGRFSVFALCLLTVAGFFVASGARAAQSYDNCTGFITSIPATISTQGTWCMKQDLATAITTGNAISITTNNVTIDCNDFKLGGLAAGVGTQANGIHSSTQLNATVRHCNIRGFYRGILLSETSGGGNLIEDNRFDGNTWAAADTHGDGSVIRRNRIFDTGGTTVPGYPAILPIITYDSADIIDNTISGVIAATGSNFSASGMYVSGNPSGTISGNRVRDLSKDGTGKNVAIILTAHGRNAVHDNDLVGDGSADSSYGILCEFNDGRARDNNINGFVTGISSCADVSGNDINP